MASSGTINGTVSLNATKFDFYVKWSIVNSDSDRLTYNRSVVRVETWLETINTSYDFDTVASRDHWMKVTGIGEDTAVQLYEWTARIDCNPWPSNPYLIKSRDFTVPHNQDGTKQIKIDAYVNALASSYGANNCNIPETTLTLDTIDRALMYVKVSGTQRLSSEIYVKVSGTWRRAKMIYVKVNGTWVISKTT